MAEPNQNQVVQQQQHMQIEYVEDKGGAKLKLQVIDGQYYPTFPTEIIKDMNSIRIRHDDVILAGYLKAGTHWVWEILRMLLAGTTEVVEAEKDQCMMEQTDQTVLDSLLSPRVLNTHVHFDKLPAEVLIQNPKIVYLTRNPKDTAVSMYHHHTKLWDYYSYDGTFDNYLHLFIEGKVDYGSWFDHIQNWSKATKTYPKMLEVNYEDMIKDPEEQMKRIATFLSLSVSGELIKKIREECSLQSMRDKKGKFDLDKEGNPIMYRKERFVPDGCHMCYLSILNQQGHDFYKVGMDKFVPWSDICLNQIGEVGDWKNYFDSDLSLWFDQAYDLKMAHIDTMFHWSFQPD